MFNKLFHPFTTKLGVQNPRVKRYTCVLVYKEMALLKMSSLLFFLNLLYHDVHVLQSLYFSLLLTFFGNRVGYKFE